MRDPHKNIFYYYRGPSKRVTDDIIYDTQVEDNTTKALINCFDNCSSSLLTHFLNYFNLDFDFIGKPQLLLQVSKTKSRPDAQIKAIQKSTYIENKIKAGLDLEQLTNHLAGIAKDDILLVITKEDIKDKIQGLAQTKHIRWLDVYNCFSDYDQGNYKEKFLIKQFLEYLEVMGLSDFKGFDNDDFDYFINKIDDYKPIIKDKFERFGYKVFDELRDEIKSIYSERYLGNVSKNAEQIWFGIRKPQNKNDVFRHCNFTIDMNSDVLRFNVVIRDGKYKDKKPIGIFYRKIKNNFDQFLDLLKAFSSDYHLKVSKRVPKSGNRIMPGNEKWEHLSILTLEIVTYETIDYILMLLKKVKFPGIRLEFSIKRGDKILNRPDLLIVKGKEALETGYKLLKFLES